MKKLVLFLLTLSLILGLTAGAEYDTDIWEIFDAGESFTADFDNDENDEKIIAIPFGDPNYNVYTDISDLPKHLFDEMAHFFTVYKALEHKQTAVQEVVGAKDAVRIIESALRQYREKFGA